MSIDYSDMLKSTSLNGIIHKIKNSEIKNIIILSGAGISVACGIPDFRSKNGLYNTLKVDALTATEPEKDAIRADPTMVVDYSLFRINPFPYLEVRRPLILGTSKRVWKPTLGHYFMKILNQKQMLRRLYTQNIDGIDHQLDLASPDRDKLIINVHGSLSEISCEACKFNDMKLDEFCQQLKANIKNIYQSNEKNPYSSLFGEGNFAADELDGPTESSHIVCPKCNRPQLKPSTVMFGRDLPAAVNTYIKKDFPLNVDLLIVIGTSLQVFPANQLVNFLPPTIPRLVINKVVVGEEMGLNYGEVTPCEADDYANYLKLKPDGGLENRDAIILGDCDKSILYLLNQLQWGEELLAFQDHMAPASRELLLQQLAETKPEA